jgi:hypothetical protein
MGKTTICQTREGYYYIKRGDPTMPSLIHFFFFFCKKRRTSHKAPGHQRDFPYPNVKESICEIGLDMCNNDTFSVTVFFFFAHLDVITSKRSRFVGLKAVVLDRVLYKS